jgi:hypothetical protein
VRLQTLQGKIHASGAGCSVRGACVDLVGPDSLHAANDPANPYPERFDLIVSTMTFHHIEDIPGEWAAAASTCSKRARSSRRVWCRGRRVLELEI